MPAPTAQLPAARAAPRDAIALPLPTYVAPRDARRPREATRVLTRLGGGRFYLVLAAVALAVAGLSLLTPSTPSYDPWSWLVWGREIIHLDLHTATGPSWKPLPMLFTTLFAVFGKAQPDLWLVVARAGALMAVAMVVKIAYRVTRDILAPATPRASAARLARVLPPLLAALIAGLGLLNSPSFVTDNALGYSEGLAAALALIAVDRFLDGAPRQAFVVGFFAALDRPELWFFWIPYGAWLAWRNPGARRLVLALFVLTPALWFLPELWGSGHLLRALTRAQRPRPGTAALTSCPVCTEFRSMAWPSLPPRVEVAAIAGLLVALGGLVVTRRTRRRRPAAAGTRGRVALAALAAFGVVWWLGISVETEAGFSGNIRYLMLGTAAVAIAGGVAWGWLAGLTGGLLSRLSALASPRRLAAAPAITLSAGAALAMGLFLALPPWVGRTAVSVPGTRRILDYQASLRHDLAAVISRSGGARALRHCGAVMTESYQVPMVAWALGNLVGAVHAPPGDIDEPPGRIAGPPWPGVILQARAHADSPLEPTPAQVTAWEHDGARYRRLAHVGTYTVLAACGPTGGAA